MRVRITEILRFSLALLILLCLAACGGGGTTVAGGGGGISGTGKQVVGEVTGFGSVIVNGVEFSTIGSAITIDDSPALESDLKTGMIVKVSGRVDDLTRKGNAVTVVARDAIEGRIDDVNSTNNTITVLGQLVRLEDNVTRFNDNDAIKTFATSGIVSGNIVEVHGYPDDAGGLRATRIVVKGTGEFETKGFVTALLQDSFGLALTPGGASFLTVRFAAGQLPAGMADGSRVQVKTTAGPVAGVIAASQIKLEDPLGAAGESVETEGIVTSGNLAAFIVNGQQVVTDSLTLFEGGVKSDFIVGAKLEAEGAMKAGGLLVASKISYRSTIKIEADVSSVVPGSSLTVLGIQVGINSFTTVDSGLSNGSHVEVRAVVDRSGSLLATRIVVLGASNKAVLQGGVSASNAAAGTLTILGIPLSSDGSTQWRISSTVGEAAVTKDLFYSSLKPYSIVKVRWDAFLATGDVIKEAEIELGK